MFRDIGTFQSGAASGRIPHPCCSELVAALLYRFIAEVTSGIGACSLRTPGLSGKQERKELPAHRLSGWNHRHAFKQRLVRGRFHAVTKDIDDSRAARPV